ncbi:MAG: 4-hydroxythreonine-4-phosphate dehydrogenase PdxA [Phycisphaerales bacterium]|nr:4-hydroxythreonine-4-phosphate dehydrogenase PdxA [Phycisphaerales bacterium]
MSSFARPKVAISLGDPGGIGPEVIVKALADPALRKQAHFRILGAQAPLDAAAHAAGIEPFWWRVSAQSPAAETAGVHDVVLLDYEPGGVVHAPRATKACGELSFRFIDDAIAQVKLPVSHPLHADAIVTGPINKAAWAKAGHKQFPGHTELLADRFGVKHFGMMFHAAGERGSPQMPHDLNVILATAHIPLMEVRNVLTIGRVSDTIDLGSDACKRLGIRNPRIAVCGLNPHAGEEGLLGDEDQRLIEPAIKIARSNGIDVSGPFPADTIFISAIQGKFDLVVAMYHDQGLIPVKLLARDRAVNMTVGLPAIRTSPDHGTAFDIAGKNLADPGSMRSAILLALRMLAAR